AAGRVPVFAPRGVAVGDLLRRAAAGPPVSGAAPRPVSGGPVTGPDQPRIRMYRHGLGDCILLTLPRPRGGPGHVLIDCGVLGTGPRRMAAVAEDLHRTTGGRLDVVVATHAHWDHVSGFVQARGLFDQMDIGEVWLPWTEDPNDPAAAAVRARRRHAL